MAKRANSHARALMLIGDILDGARCCWSRITPRPVKSFGDHMTRQSAAPSVPCSFLRVGPFARRAGDCNRVLLSISCGVSGAAYGRLPVRMPLQCMGRRNTRQASPISNYADPAMRRREVVSFSGRTGSFDTLNPLIIRGEPVAGIREWVYETLMARGFDEPFTMYGLVSPRAWTMPAGPIISNVSYRSRRAVFGRQDRSPPTT